MGMDFYKHVMNLPIFSEIFYSISQISYLELENWGIDGFGSVTFEHVNNFLDNGFADCHLGLEK